MARLRLRGIAKQYGRVRALSAIDLDFADGELVVLVGPSGCGKSTLLRIVAGLEQASSGRIELDDVDVTSLPPVRRGVAMVFQNYALYPHMNVADNIGFGLSIAGMPRAERMAAIREAAKTLHLEPYLTRMPAALSGGQRQRVAIGRALVRKPKLFLFDEPLSNLDAELRTHMRLEIARLHRSLATSMIYVTHDQVEAMTLADRIVVMRDGAIEQVGTPQALYASPDNLFVARFLGTPKLNTVSARILDIGPAAMTLAVPSLREEPIVVEICAPSELALGAAVTLAWRPGPLEAPPIGDHARITARMTVELVEWLGGVAHVLLGSDGGDNLTCECRGVMPERGTRLEIAIDRSALMLFGPDGRRLRTAREGDAPSKPDHPFERTP